MAIQHYGTKSRSGLGAPRRPKGRQAPGAPRAVDTFARPWDAHVFRPWWRTLPAWTGALWSVVIGSESAQRLLRGERTAGTIAGTAVCVLLSIWFTAQARAGVDVVTDGVIVRGGFRDVYLPFAALTRTVKWYVPGFVKHGIPAVVLPVLVAGRRRVPVLATPVRDEHILPGGEGEELLDTVHLGMDNAADAARHVPVDQFGRPVPQAPPVVRSRWRRPTWHVVVLLVAWGAVVAAALAR